MAKVNKKFVGVSMTSFALADVRESSFLRL